MVKLLTNTRDVWKKRDQEDSFLIKIIAYVKNRWTHFAGNRSGGRCVLQVRRRTRRGTRLAEIHDAMTIARNDGRTLVIEVQQHIGEDTVRCVAMDSTDGLKRGMEVVPTGHPITMPIGNQIKGRVMNVVGDTIDGMKSLDKKDGFPIHREPPKFEDLATTQEVLFTGIKVIDLLEPYLKGGKIGLFGGAGVGKPCSSKS